jgi:hypothetical protein
MTDPQLVKTSPSRRIAIRSNRLIDKTPPVDDAYEQEMEKVVDGEFTHQEHKCCACTIMSPDFLPQSLAAIGSMQRYVPNIDYRILVTRNTTHPATTLRDIRQRLGVIVSPVKCLMQDRTAQHIIQKYNTDQLRWSLKACWLEHLLKCYEKVIYVDNDCYFLNNFQFLFDNLDDHGILLTPHWRLMQPSIEFAFNLSDGIFNAGFVGTNKDAKPMLEWWKNMCEWKCSYSPHHGLFVDQKYLDLVPVLFEDDYKTIQHRGCNVASWNATENKRVLQKDGSVLINGQWPIIFVHLSHWKKDEKFLAKYVKMYQQETEAYRRWLYEAQNMSAKETEAQ